MRGKSSAALTEILLAVLFFALSAAALARLFAGADGIARESALREDAAMAAREWAERAAAGGGIEDMLLGGGWSSTLRRGDGKADQIALLRGRERG